MGRVGFNSKLRRLCRRMSARIKANGTLDDDARRKFIQEFQGGTETMALLGCVLEEDLEAALRFSNLLAGVRQLQRRTLERFRDYRARELGFRPTDDQLSCFAEPNKIDPDLTTPGISDEQRGE